MIALSLYEQALKYEREGNYARAFNLFQECLAGQEYERGDLLFHCGWCLEQEDSRDMRQALSFYREAAETGENLTCKMNSLFRAGWLLMHEKDYPAAAEYYHRVIRLGNAAAICDEIYHNALYWLAVSLEAQGQYIEALKCYRAVQKISALLNPESRFREINCLNQIGSFSEALTVCKSFEEPPPTGFDEARYRELRALADKEYRALETCLSEEFTPTKEPL